MSGRNGYEAASLPRHRFGRPARWFAAGLASVFVLSCSGSPVFEPAAAPATTASAPTVSTGELNLRLKRLEFFALDRLPATKITVAVIPLATNELSAIEPDLIIKSASAAKVWWAAAALDTVGVGPVQPLARETFEESSDFTAEEMIRLAGGPDSVNRFTRDRAGMHDTGLVRWQGLELQVATNVPARLGASNYTTGRDMVTFLARLERGEVLDRERTATLLGWMRMSPRGHDGGYGGHLPELLPPEVSQRVAHKAGWLLPAGGEPFTLLEIGVVYPQRGAPYAIAITGTTASDFGPLESFVAYASCAVYQLVAGDSGWPCDDGTVIPATGTVVPSQTGPSTTATTAKTPAGQSS